MREGRRLTPYMKKTDKHPAPQDIKPHEMLVVLEDGVWYLALDLDYAEKKDLQGSRAEAIVVDDVLTQRGNTYGSFADNSEMAVSLLATLAKAEQRRSDKGMDPLTPWEKNALIMIFEKASRIMTGKPHEDNWIDIAGYAELGRNPR